MCSKLEADSSGLSLKLVSKSGPLVIYNQKNLSASRKTILPLITQALSQLAETPAGIEKISKQKNFKTEKSIQHN